MLTQRLASAIDSTALFLWRLGTKVRARHAAKEALPPKHLEFETADDFVKRHGLRLSRAQMGSLGQEASRRCGLAGIRLLKRYNGSYCVNVYPTNVLEEMLPSLRDIEAAGPWATEGPLSSGGHWRAWVAWTNPSSTEKEIAQ